MRLGLIRWLKKEIDGSNSQRRQSAPPVPLKNSNSRDEAYVEKMAKFIEWRNTDRQRRASEVTNSAMSIPSQQHHYPYPTDDSESIDNGLHPSDGGSSPIDEMLTARHGHLHTHITHGVDEVDHAEATHNPAEHRFESKHRMGIPRQQSLPSNMSKSYIGKAYRRKKKGPAPQPTADPNIIHEDEVKEFEGYHCSDGFGDNGPQDNPLSPPMKFYKQNLNPYPLFASDNASTNTQTIGGSSTDSGYVVDAKRLSANLQNCPAKPKRLLLKPQNMQKNTKELTDAHFQGHYRNYEVHSPYYESRQRDFGMASVVTDARDNHDGGSGRYSPRYESIKNKHGDVVEYAKPFYEHRKRDSQLDFASHHQMQDEDDFLQDDIKTCENIVNQNFGFLNAEKFGDETYGNRSSLYTKRPRISTGPILITDLDKSVDSSKTLDDKRQSTVANDIFEELNALSKWSHNASRCADNNIKTQRDLMELYNVVKASVPCCRAKELRTKVTVLQNTYRSPIDITSGIFRKTKVALRNYSVDADSAKSEQMALAAEAIKRDLEIIRYIRHQNIITLMAVSFNMQQKQITLVLEPVDCTLSYMLYEMKELPTLFDSISIVQQIAGAALYLHECGFVHSNISSHCILMSKLPNHVKLSSFELATSVSNSVRKDIETKYRRSSKRIDDNAYDKMLDEQFAIESKPAVNVSTPSAFSTQCLRDVDANLLPYYMDYRRQLTVHNYQAPELLTSMERMVFPSRSCDVYSLTLLLWEMLHGTKPYAQFDEDELKQVYEASKSESLIAEKNGLRDFEQIFKYGSAIDPVNRSLTVQHFISLLEDSKFYIDKHSVMQNDLTENRSKMQTIDAPPSMDTMITDDRKENIYENTNDIVEDIEAQMISPMLMNEANRYFMPSPKVAKESPKATGDGIVLSPLHNITNSTMYRSIMDFQTVLSPHRNSTMKRKPNKKISPYCGESPKLNDNISQTMEQLESSEHHETIGSAFAPSRKTIQNQQNKFMDQILGDQKENLNDKHQPIVITVTPKETLGTSTINDSHTNFKIHLNNSKHMEREHCEDGDVSDMQIARKNLLRRNAWLSNELNVDQFFTSPPPRAIEEHAEDGVSVSSSTPPASIEDAIIKINDIDKIILSTSSDSSASLASDETVPMNRKVNVSIKIVHKQITPEKVETSASNASMFFNDESPSVMSRIKFWNSLECPIITPKSAVKPNLSFNQSTRMPELIEVSDRSTLSPTPPPIPLPQPTKNRRLLQEINDISAEITRCMEANALNKLIKSKQMQKTRSKPNKSYEVSYTENPNANELNNSIQIQTKPIETINESVRLEKEIQQEEKELLTQRENASLVTYKLQEKIIDNDVLKSLIAAQRRNSVSETVFRIENGLNVNSLLSTPLKKIENKLFNEKINNTDLNTSDIEDAVPLKEIDDDLLKIVEEKPFEEIYTKKSIEPDDVREIHGRVVGVDDVENDASNAVSAEPPQFEIIENTETHKEIQTPMLDEHCPKNNQTMIKRTFYRESIITGSGIDTPELERMLDTQTTRVTQSASKNKLTTRVTLNLRNFKRRSSDFGLPRIDADESNQSPRMAEARHSICGNELALGSRSPNVIQTTSGRKLDQFLNTPSALRIGSCTCVPNSLSQLSMNFSARTNRNKDIQSIEDLYIDDDFCQGLCLAANMKLVTNSNETLGMDNIDFDVLTARIYEGANESLTGEFDELDDDTKNA